VQRELLDENFAFASPRGTITRWGAGAVRLFGVASDDVAGRSLFDSVLGDDDGGWRMMLEQESGSAQRVVETELRRADGREFPCEVRFFPVALADGLDFSSFASELTADRPLEDREDRLRERHARVVGLLDEGSEGNGTVEVEDRLAGIVVTFRSTAEGPITEDELLEDAIERTERTEREVDDLREPVARLEAQAERLAAKVEEALQGMSALADRVGALERGAQEASPAAPDDLDELRAGVADARRQAAEAQREAQTTRRALAALRPLGAGAGDLEEEGRPPREGFDDATVPMATLTLGGNFMELNPGFRELVGYSEEEFSHARWPSNVDRARLADHEGLRKALAAGELEGTHLELAYMHREGLLVELSGRISLVRTPDGTPDHLLLTLDVR
jgi:PAS domain S-box-containing protein